MANCVLIVVLLSLIGTVVANMCVSKTNCRDCVTSIHSCAWCLQNVNNTDFNRCDYAENIAKYCDKEFIFNPENEIKIVKASLSSYSLIPIY